MATNNIIVGNDCKVYGRWSTIVGNGIVSVLDFDVQIGEQISIPPTMEEKMWVTFQNQIAERQAALKILVDAGQLTREKFNHIRDVSNMIVFLIQIGTKIIPTLPARDGVIPTPTPVASGPEDVPTQPRAATQRPEPWKTMQKKGQKGQKVRVEHVD